MRYDCCDTEWHPFLGHRHIWGRRFFTEEETQELQKRRRERKVKWMTQYKEALENELKGVTEQLNELQNDTA